MSKHTAPTAVLGGTEDEVTPPTMVQPANYLQLRLLAECAVGINEREANFLLPGGESVQLADDTTVLSDDDVVVPTFEAGKYPRNTVSLGLSSTWLPEKEMPLTGADALFWSDAAVEKFLLPYLASCGWRDAARIISQVQRAWNDYPADTVEVYALAHVNIFPVNVPLLLENSLQVVYRELADGAKLKLMLLPEFLVAFPSVEPSPPDVGTVPFQRGVPPRSAPFPDYLTLRAMAEWAGSLRDEPRYFLFPAGHKGFVRPTTELPAVLDGDIVVPAFTPANPQERPTLPGVWFQGPAATVPTNLASEADALFWSTGAIDQFLYPYYASKVGLEGLRDLWEIGSVWTGEWWTGLPESVLTRGSFELARPGGGTSTVNVSSDAPAEPGTVAALIHLPSSLWTEVTEESQVVQTPPEGPEVTEQGGRHRVITRVNPKHHLGVVSVHARGETRVHSVAEFMARHPRTVS